MVVDTYLMFRVAGRLCAIPGRNAVEVLRPLPVERLTDTPDFVMGASMIRGAPTPVVDLGVVLAGVELAQANRILSIRGDGDRLVALLVDDVVGLFPADRLHLSDAPPLLRDADQNRLSALGRLDDALLTVLELGRLVPDSVWQAVDGGPQ